MDIQTYLSSLVNLLAASNHRVGLTIQGDVDWQSAVINQLTESLQCSLSSSEVNNKVFQVGESELGLVTKKVAYNKGQQLLGQECRLLIVDCAVGFDANSFSSALGTLKGGGALLILNPESLPASFSSAWLKRSFGSLICLNQNLVLPNLPSLQDTHSFDVFSEQNRAIELVKKVVTGHRKRPLVLTADRGRGKTSALGIAAGQLMSSRKIHIVVTAPSFASVQPLFEHAQRELPDGDLQRGCFTHQLSRLEFVAPDDLLSRSIDCDLLLVDEASAIPIPMLKRITEQHHRCVFSTTIHGYEGCGRGFTLKFQQWLRQQRPSSVFYHIEQPIRWSRADPLETWHYQTFLLDVELEEVELENLALEVVQNDFSLVLLDKQTLFESPKLLRSCFSLLVNAHYQTSPNDLMLLLSDDSMLLHALFSDDICIGCTISVAEGCLEAELVEQIQLGRRRPKGHLAPVTLAHQLGITKAALQSSLRVMRIAVHPTLQRTGIGARMIRDLEENSDFDFYSTSFGATSDLVSFWRKNNYVPVKLGVQRDQASGCHSLLMVKGNQPWMEDGIDLFSLSFHYSLSGVYSDLEVDMVRSLFCLLGQVGGKQSHALPIHPLVKIYLDGGASYEAVAPLLARYIQSNPNLIVNASDLIIRKLLQRHTWQQCSYEFSFPGRKQTECQLREDIKALFV